jgi:hypothetical protein
MFGPHADGARVTPWASWERSTRTMRVGRYEVVADSEIAERASALLGPGG